MSVRGEFVRTVEDAVACLRECEAAPARALGAKLEKALSLAREDLEGAARTLLAGWEGFESDALSLAPPARVRLEDASERMLAISKLILGR